ncbi:hypothetical protein H9P43_007922 [Blastocladiella emersonii ATCC 22665]|nr:hypothetical protein H9P43_007922 [Blastocladiella emersonii ATCC 22665]
MKPLPRLAPELLDRILVAAVHLHDPDEVPAMLSYLRVVPMHQVPSVWPAIQAHVLSVSMTEASMTNRLHVLDMWRQSAAARLHRPRYYTVFDWWRRSGLLAAGDLARAEPKVHFYGEVGHVYEGMPRNLGDSRFEAMLSNIISGELETVSVRYARITAHGADKLAIAFASPTQRVTAVSLTFCDLTFPEIRALRLPETVKTLTLDHNWVCEGVTHDDAGATVFPRGLKTLNMDTCQIGGATPGGIFRYLPPALRTLNLAACDFGPEAARQLALHFPPTVTWLSLSGSTFAPGALRVALLRLPPQLESLLLSNCIRDPAEVRGLAPLLPAGLKHLILSNNAITRSGLGDAGVVALVRGCPPNLKTLQLNKLQLTEIAFHALVRGLPPSIQQFEFKGCTIGDSPMPLPPASMRVALTAATAAPAVDAAKTVPAADESRPAGPTAPKNASSNMPPPPQFMFPPHPSAYGGRPPCWHCGAPPIVFVPVPVAVPVPAWGPVPASMGGARCVGDDCGHSPWFHSQDDW